MIETNSGTANELQNVNSSASDYTDPRYMAAAAMSTIDYCDEDLGERARRIHECRMFLFSRLGAVLTASGYAVRYWIPGPFCVVTGPQDRPRRISYFAGFCSRSRGLHWDRKRD